MILLITWSITFIALIIMLVSLRYHLYNDGQLYISNKLVVSGALGVTYILLCKNHFEAYGLYLFIASFLISLSVIITTPFNKKLNFLSNSKSTFLYYFTLVVMILMDVFVLNNYLISIPVIILLLGTIFKVKFFYKMWLLSLLIYVSLHFIVSYFLSINLESISYFPSWIPFLIITQSLILRNKIFFNE